MRNLKRALSLTLASVMLLGMMVVGAGAAGYPDVNEEDHDIEAIEVLQAVKVMQGNDKGEFDPDSQVNRSQMAVVMANLLNLDYNYYEASCPFWDVPDWAKPYVAACYANGIVSGYNATTYGAADSVTAVQAASMMMRALGYFKYQEDYDQNGGFELATVKQANAIGLFDGLNANATAALTRNQVAKLALNALEANMVEFTGTPGTSIDLGDGKKVNVGYKAEYSYRTGTEKKYAALSKLGDTTNVIGSGAQGRYYVQLGEELYNGKLTKSSTYDNFERPTTTWRYDYTKIGEYLKTPDLTYTKDVKMSDIYNDLGLAAAVVADKVDFYRNGDTETTVLGTDAAGNSTYIVDNSSPAINLSTLGLARGTGNKIGDKGVLTQVWYYGDTDTARITMIDTYVGKISSVVAATSSADRYVVVNLVNRSSEGRDPETPISTNFDTENFAVDDLVMITAARDEDTNRYVIETVDPLEVSATGLLTRWEGGSTINTPTGTSNANFTAGGTKYDYSRFYRIADENDAPINISNFTVNKSDVNVYLDKYGYAIYVSGVKGTKNYAAVIGWGNVNQYGSDTRGATLLLPDGTTQEVIAKLPSGVSGWTSYFTAGYGINSANVVDDGVADLVTYTVGDDGIYTLTKVGSHKTAAGNVFSGQYDTDAAGTIATFESGKSLMSFNTKFPGTAPVSPSTDWTFGAAAPKNFYTTSETIFMVATRKTTTNAAGYCNGYNYNVYTGYANAPSFMTATENYPGIIGIAFAMDSRYTNQIDVVYIDAVDMAGVATADTYFVKAAPGKNNVITDNDNVAYLELPAVVNNEITTIRIQADMVKYWDNDATPESLRNAPAGVYALNNVRTNSSGYITGCSVVSSTRDEAGALKTNGSIFGSKLDGTVQGRTGKGTIQANEIVVGIKYDVNNDTVIDDEFWAYNADSKVYYIANDYKSITEGTVASVYTDANDDYWMTVNSSSKVMTKMFIRTVNPGVTYTVQASTGVLFSNSLNGTYTTSLTGVGEGDHVYVIARDVTMKPVYGNALTLGGYTATALDGTVNPATATIEGRGAYWFTMPAASVVAGSFTTTDAGFAPTVALTASGTTVTATVTPGTVLSNASAVTYKYDFETESTGNWFVAGSVAASSSTSGNFTAGAVGDTVRVRATVTVYINGVEVCKTTSSNYSFTLSA